MRNRFNKCLVGLLWINILTWLFAFGAFGATPAVDLDQWGVVTYSTIHGVGLSCWVKVIDHDGVSSDGSSHSVTVTFPDGVTTYQMTFDHSESPTSGYYGAYVDLSGSPPQGQYTFKVTDMDQNVGTAVDNLVVDPIAPPNENSFTPMKDSVTPDTTPTFTWNAVAEANGYSVNIYSGDNSQNIWRGWSGNQTSYTVPPGVLSPSSEYRYYIEAWDAHSPLDIDNVSKSPASWDDHYRFFTGVESAAPFIDLDSTGVQTWNDELVGGFLDFWIKVHDAQGIPGDIRSAKVALPSGAEELLYYDVGNPFNTATCGIFRSSSFLPIEDGTYTFTVEDREGHVYSVTEDLNPALIGYPAETSLRPVHSSIIGDTAVDFDWEDVPGKAFYWVEIYDKDYNSIYGFATTESEYHLPAGFLKEETLYRYRIMTRREFFDQNVDNGSNSPWAFHGMPAIVTTPVTGGSFSPSIDLINWGALTKHIVKPGSGDSGYLLEFVVRVTDQDGVPANIGSVSVTYPDGTTRHLWYDEEATFPEANYLFFDFYDSLQDIQQGTYTLTVTDFDGNSAQASDDLMINVLPVPTNCTPIQDTTVVGTTPTIEWDDVPGATRYRVIIYDGWDGIIHWSDYLADSSYNVPAGILESGKLYSYRIDAYRETAPSEDLDNAATDQFYFGETNHFTTLPHDGGDDAGGADGTSAGGGGGGGGCFISLIVGI